MEEEKDQLIKRVERLKKRVTFTLPLPPHTLPACTDSLRPLGGGSVQPPEDARAGPTAACGEGAGGGADSSETGAEEPGKGVIQDL